MTAQLPLSYTQQWVTLYMMVAGTRPISAQEAIGLLTPWLSGKFVSPQSPEVKSVRVSVAQDPDVGPVIVSAPFTEGGRLTQAGSLGNTIVTGIKWNLRTPNATAVTDELIAALRSGIRTAKQPFELLGFKVFLNAVQAFGQPFGGQIIDFKIPATPALPQVELPKPKPAPSPSPAPAPAPIPSGPQYSLIHWAIGATALILVAVATKKINGEPKPQMQLQMAGCSRRRR